MHCPQCGSEVALEDRFCRRCGTALQQSAESVSAPQQVSRHKWPWGPKKKAGIAVLLVLALIWVFIVATSGRQQSRNRTPGSSSSQGAQGFRQEQQGLTILSYGHTNRGFYLGDSRLFDVSWHVELHNQTGGRIPNLYVAYHWLDKNKEQLKLSNAITNIGAGEHLTITGSATIEARLYEQVRYIGIELSAPGMPQGYAVLPLSTESSGGSPRE